MALRLLGVFWLVMSAAGLVTEELFKAIGWVPSARHGVVVGDTLRWDWTTYLDIAALVAFGALYWLYRNRDRFGGGAGYAKDPVCGMQVEAAHAPAGLAHEGHRVYFCSENCKDRFLADPGRFVAVSEKAVPARPADCPEQHCDRAARQSRRARGR